MTKRHWFAFILSFGSLLAFSEPDRGVWVIDQLIGFRDDSMIYRQIVTDNEGSHYRSHIESYIVEKNMRTNEVLSIERVSYVEYRYDSLQRKTESIGRSEDKLIDVVNKRPYLFYELDYAIPLGVPDDESRRISFKDDLVIVGNEKESREQRYDVRKAIPKSTIKEKAKSLLQVYEYRDCIVVLIDFGEPYGDANYYQKLIAIPRS